MDCLITGTGKSSSELCIYTHSVVSLLHIYRKDSRWIPVRNIKHIFCDPGVGRGFFQEALPKRLKLESSDS